MGLLDSLLAATSGGGDPVDLNSIAGNVQALGSNMSAASHVQFGIQARQAAQFQADQLRQNANTAQAASQRQAFDIDRQTQYITSRALAVAAASGGGASDPTVVRLIARDAGEGAYQKSLALYGGSDQARLDLENAEAKTYEGKTTERNALEVGAAGYGSGATNLLRSRAKGASLMQRFGGDGPQVGGFSKAPGVGDSGWGSDITGGGS